MKDKVKVRQIVELYKKEFYMGWVDTFDWSDDAKCQESLGVLKDKIGLFEQNVFCLFSQSVLSAEYLIRQDYEKILDSLYELFSNGEIYDDERNKYRTVAILTFNELIYEMLWVIKSLRHLITTLANKYEERRTKYIVNAYRVKGGVSPDSKYARYYEILIEVTRIDHFLSYEKRNISDLILYHSELSKGLEDKNIRSDIQTVIDILNEKCLFLLKKLLIEDNKEFAFMIDFKPTRYDTDNLKFKYFAVADKRFDFYRAESYSFDAYGDELDKRVNSRNSLFIGLYPLIMKYYKDSRDTKVQQIDNILKDFDEAYENLSKEFTQRPLDRYALGTLKNYMYNCRFSFMMQSPKYTFEMLKKGLDEVMVIQAQTRILNFYPYRKAFEKALVLLHNNETLDKEVLNDYREFLNLCIAKFSEAMLWCRVNCFYPIQNCYRECLNPVPDFGAVFIASSYCRPVRYGKLKDELNTFKNQALLVDNEIALREEKKQMQDLKKDIDNSQMKQVEILSFFMGVITFLFGTIGFFANNANTDFVHLLFSIFGLGAILLIFVSGIHLVTMRKEEKVGDYFKHPRAWFCIVTFIISVGLLVWLVAKVNLLAE